MFSFSVSSLAGDIVCSSLLKLLCCFISSDVDECKSSVCPSSLPCINTFGSFTCDCGSGQQYNATEKKCIGNENEHCNDFKMFCLFLGIVKNVSSY